ncbi:unnamed protein product, partial [marine sediment metagenome]
MTFAEKDKAVWRQWQRAQTPSNMDTVLHQLNPIIQQNVNRWAGTLARPLLELEAKRLAAEAIRTYSPVGGASLATHVTNRLRKLSRITYTHQNVARLPEHRMVRFHTFNMANSVLEDRLGREPTVDELVDELGWSRSYLEYFQKGQRKELLESAPVPAHFDSRPGDEGFVDFIYNDLSPMQKKIFEHTTGYGGMVVMGNPKLKKKLKLSQGQL